MKKKIIIGLSIILVVILAGVGVIFRMNVKNTYNTEEGRDDLYIAVMDKSIAEGPLDHQKEILQASPVIIKAKSLGGSEYVYKNLKQEVEVQQVIKGDGQISEGDRVYVVGTGERYTNQNGDKCVNCKFMNFMQAGDEYLIFLQEKVDWEVEDDIAVYSMNFDAITLQYVNLNKNQTEISTNEERFQLYKDVKHLEFYTNDIEVLNKWNQIKSELIEEYIK